MKRFLGSINDLDAKAVERIYELTREVKGSPEKFQNVLRRQMFGLIFEKPSTRTWVSFQAGIFSLGGGVIYLGPNDIKLGVREEVRDVARVLERYLSGVVLRTFSHRTITEFAKYFRKPVINGLSDFEHPCQALTDFFTMREKFSENRKPVLAYVGDGNNVLSSLILLAAMTGEHLRYATPSLHEPHAKVLEKAKKLIERSGAVIEGGHDPAEAVRGADFVYTDVWISMGEEKMRAEKIGDFQGFQVDSKLMAKANQGARLMHCLPAHRGEEVTDEVIESERSIVFDQAENRLHVQKAILLYLCS